MNTFTVKKIWVTETKVIFLIISAVFLAYFVNFTGAFFWTLFLACIFFSIDTKIVGQAALVCLICLPLLLFMNKNAEAEQVAVYTFYLLAMTVALQIIELKRHPEMTPVREEMVPARTAVPKPIVQQPEHQRAYVMPQSHEHQLPLQEKIQDTLPRAQPRQTIKSIPTITRTTTPSVSKRPVVRATSPVLDLEKPKLPRKRIIKASNVVDLSDIYNIKRRK